MPSHPIDFELQANFFVTPELRDVFSETRKMDRWLQVEAALARVQGQLGIIPEEAAGEIAAKAGLDQLDRALIEREYDQARNSLMPVIKVLRKACRDNCGQYVHYGATTQDILDTAQVLELGDGLQIIYRDLRRVEQLLIDLSSAHRDTAMIGRTHGQQALPITFGLKTVVWASEVRRHIQRLKSIYPRVMVGQLSGAVGTMASLGPKARLVAEQTMALLNLGWNPPGWHTSRDNIAEVASLYALIAGSLEKMANEVFLLGKTEIDELAESAPDKTMSSAMPHKKNPVLCQRVSVLCRHIRSLTAVVVESMPHEHERDPRLLWSEWLAMPQLSMYTGTAAAYLADILAGLEVRKQNMEKNLMLHSDMVMSEWLLFRLAPVMGKMQAQDKLRILMRKMREEQAGLPEMLRRDAEIGPLLDEKDMDRLDHPELYTGHSAAIVDETLQAIRSQRQDDPRELPR